MDSGRAGVRRLAEGSWSDTSPWSCDRLVVAVVGTMTMMMMMRMGETARADCIRRMPSVCWVSSDTVCRPDSDGSNWAYRLRHADRPWIRPADCVRFSGQEATEDSGSTMLERNWIYSAELT